MESAAAFGSIFTGGSFAPMIFSRRSAAADHLQEVIKNIFLNHALSQPGGESQAQRRIAGW